jgi:hypothetical protein
MWQIYHLNWSTIAVTRTETQRLVSRRFTDAAAILPAETRPYLVHDHDRFRGFEKYWHGATFTPWFCNVIVTR